MIGMPSAFALGIFSGKLFLIFVFEAPCGALQTHFHEKSENFN